MHLLLVQRRDERGELHCLGKPSRVRTGQSEINVNLGRRRAAQAFLCLMPALACVGVLAMTACRAGTASARDISVREEIAPTPVREGTASVTIHLANTQGQPVSSAHINVEGDMAHPGMAPVFAAAAESSPGTYRAAIDFNMPGDWVVLLHIRLADGRRIERQLDVKGVRPR
jgi:hypothetical protein